MIPAWSATEAIRARERLDIFFSKKNSDGKGGCLTPERYRQRRKRGGGPKTFGDFIFQKRGQFPVFLNKRIFLDGPVFIDDKMEKNFAARHFRQNLDRSTEFRAQLIAIRLQRLSVSVLPIDARGMKMSGTLSRRRSRFFMILKREEARRDERSGNGVDPAVLRGSAPRFCKRRRALQPRTL